MQDDDDMVKLTIGRSEPPLDETACESLAYSYLLLFGVFGVLVCARSAGLL